MANTQTEMGRNRTGIATSPKLTQEMVAGAQEFAPTPDGDENIIARVRQEYALDAEPLGSVPPPATVTGAAKTAVRGAKGLRPTQFVDKLGERLAFERTGVRLYEALISKFDTFGGFEGGPTRQALVDIMNQEYEHFTLLSEAVAQVGGDPTVVTPSADLHATMTAGVMAVMVDPRTTSRAVPRSGSARRARRQCSLGSARRVGHAERRGRSGSEIRGCPKPGSGASGEREELDRGSPEALTARA